MADVGGGHMGSRGVSTTIGYVLNLAVALLLVTALLAAAGSFVDDQRHRATRSELSVVGQRFVAALGTASRLNATVATGYVNVTLPREAAGNAYLIEVRPSQHEIDLNSPQTGITVTISYPASIHVKPARVNGGKLSITYQPGAGTKLEVANA